MMLLNPQKSTFNTLGMRTLSIATVRDDDGVFIRKWCLHWRES